MPSRRRGALVCVATGCGLRWGECAGLAWDAVDLVGAELHVRGVAVEVSGRVSVRPYPKTRAGLRTVPMPDFVVSGLTARRDQRRPRPSELVSGTRAGTPMRPNFRRVWRTSLVRAGLRGEVAEQGPDKWRATWPDETGSEWGKEFTTECEAAAYVAEHGVGGLRFHGSRHSYATWLVSDGVPINVVRWPLGHEQMSTTLNRYTHDARDYDDLRVRAVFKRTNVDDSLTG
jgi:integrase